MRSTFRKAGLIALLSIFLFVAQPVSAQDSVSTKEAVRYLKRVYNIYKKRFYDPNMHGVNWRMQFQKAKKMAKRVRTRTQLHTLVNRMISTLKASHCGLYPPYATKHFLQPILDGGKTKASIVGVFLMKDGDKYFVGRIYGPARKSKVRRGDQVISINGTPTHKSDRLAPVRPYLNISYMIKVQGDSEIELEVRHKSMGSSEKVIVKPERSNLTEDSINSIKIIEKDGKKLAYVHFWHFMSKKMYNKIKAALTGKLKNADGLILDLRGRGGKPSIMKNTLKWFGYNDSTPLWKKPVVAVIDGSCTSAKEIFSYFWKKQGLGPLVGQRTKGAVLGATFEEMSDGAMLEFPVKGGGRYTGGKKLEGVGVAPDISVPVKIRYTNGSDPVLEKGIEVLLRKLK